MLLLSLDVYLQVSPDPTSNRASFDDSNVPGLGVGGTSCLVPMYQSECAPKHIRGAIVAGYQWAITWVGLIHDPFAVLD